jgi:hypothetical protein
MKTIMCSNSDDGYSEEKKLNPDVVKMILNWVI